MLFNSVEFWAFFCVVFCLYYLVRPRYQWVVLLAASFAFYLYGGPRLAVFLLFSILLTWAAARKMGENNRRTADVLKARRQELSREERKALPGKKRQSQPEMAAAGSGRQSGRALYLKIYRFSGRQSERPVRPAFCKCKGAGGQFCPAGRPFLLYLSVSGLCDRCQPGAV